MIHPDEERVAALAKVVEAGGGAQVVVSHDSVWCWRGQPIPDLEAIGTVAPNWQPMHFLDNIVPRLREAGVGEDQIDRMTVENPRRFFAGEALP